MQNTGKFTGASLIWGASLLLLGSAANAASSTIPKTMKAIRSDPGGGRGALKLETVDVPSPSEGQVLIRVYAAGTNPVDWNSRGPAPAAPAPGTPAPPARFPGSDVAGVVVALGSGVTDYKPGDKVFTAIPGANGGAYAQYAVVAASELAMKPKKFTFEQAAGIPIAGYTGLRMVLISGITKGQRVLVIGAAGGVGSSAVQAAKSVGAHVIADAASRHHAYLQSLGANEIIDYDRESVADSARAVAVVLNTVGSENAAALTYVKPGATVVDAAGQVDQAACAAAGVTCIRVQRQGLTNAQLLKQLSSMADAGQYRVKVEKRFPLAKTAEALDYGRTGDREGKVIIDVRADAGRT